jgi:hypothetical protein
MGSPLRHGGKYQPLVIVAGIGPANDFVDAAEATDAKAFFHRTDIDAG